MISNTVPWSRALAARASRERGRHTVANLLDAAVAEFAAYGYHGARVARVAKRAGTAHGTFYVYFRRIKAWILQHGDRQQELLKIADALWGQIQVPTAG